MAGHRDGGGAQLRQRERDVAGGLRGVDDQRHARLVRGRGHRCERQHDAGHVRGVRDDGQARVRVSRSAAAHSSRSSAPVLPSARTMLERAAAGLLEVAQRAHHRVVLERRRDDAAAVGGEPVDREVERLGRVLGEDQLVGRLGAEQVGEPLAGEADGARRRDRAAVAGAAGVAARVLEEVRGSPRAPPAASARTSRRGRGRPRRIRSPTTRCSARSSSCRRRPRCRSRRGTTRRRSVPGRRARAAAAGRRPRASRRSRAASAPTRIAMHALRPDGVVPAAISPRPASLLAIGRSSAEGDPRGDEQRDHPFEQLGVAHEHVVAQAADRAHARALAEVADDQADAEGDDRDDHRRAVPPHRERGRDDAARDADERDQRGDVAVARADDDASRAAADEERGAHHERRRSRTGARCRRG